MENTIFTLSLIILWFISCAVSACMGFALSERIGRKKEKPASQPETDPEKRKREQLKREYENFMSYTGKRQE